jgi:Phycobilisome degradation protein nblA
MTPINLTLEHEFEIRAFAERSKTLTDEQRQAFLVEIFQKMIEQREVCKQILGHSLGLADIPEFDGLSRHE